MKKHLVRVETERNRVEGCFTIIFLMLLTVVPPVRASFIAEGTSMTKLLQNVISIVKTSRLRNKKYEMN